MQFFLYEIVARIVGVYFCFDCGRDLLQGFADRKMTVFSSDWLDWSSHVFDRDAAPVRYWMAMGLELVALLGCLIVAMFGWWLPDV